MGWDLSDMIGRIVTVRMDPNDKDQCTVNFFYPHVFNTDYLRQEIRLEIGPLAEWVPSHPVAITSTLDGKRFSSTEQYIMYRKCMILGDEAAAKQVMTTDDPGQQQAIGRNARNYHNTVWDGVCQVVAMRGLLAKFSQHDDLRQKLLETGNAYLVECARSDRRWACGIGLYDDNRRDIDRWKGKNILGFALMEVRKSMRNDTRK